MAFYKKDGEELLEAPNFVYSKDYTLLVEDKDTYIYPVDGWQWFEGEDEARLAYNLPKPEVQE